MFLWQAVFSIQLSYALLWLGASACEVLEGLPNWMDGNEVFYGTAWPGVILLVLISLGVVWRKRASK